MKQYDSYKAPKHLTEAVNDFIQYKKSLGFNAGYEYQRHFVVLATFLYENNPSHEIRMITKEVADRFIDQYKGRKPNTINRKQSMLRQYGLYLNTLGYNAYVYPEQRMLCPKDFTPYIFSKEEIYRILAEADAIGPNKNKFVNTPLIYPAILRVLYGCGTRIGETVAIKTKDVDLSEGILTIHHGKNNVSRVIPMSDSLTAYLKVYNEKVDRTGNVYFFPSLNRECYAPLTISNMFHKLMSKAGINVLSNGKLPRLHDLRHTFAVHALEKSISDGYDPYCSLPALSTYMGHKGIESTEYYLRLTKHYFVNVLKYTAAQADMIFPEVEL